MTFGAGTIRTSATSSQLHVPPVGRVDLHLADVAQAVARCRRAAHVHVVGLAVPEDVADLFAREHGRRRPAHVAGFESVPLGLGEVDLDLDLRHVGLELDVLLDDAVDSAEASPTSSALLCRPFRSSP